MLGFRNRILKLYIDETPGSSVMRGAIRLGSTVGCEGTGFRMEYRDASWTSKSIYHRPTVGMDSE
jgi:hypothetical protein